MKKRICLLLLVCLTLNLFPQEADAAEGYATVVSKGIVNAGGWRDGYFLFDYVVVYRWPRNSVWANFVPRTCRAQAAIDKMRATNGVSNAWADNNYRYIRIQAGFRARVQAPLISCASVYAFTSQLATFANELPIKYRTR